MYQYRMCCQESANLCKYVSVFLTPASSLSLARASNETNKQLMRWEIGDKRNKVSE